VENSSLNPECLKCAGLNHLVFLAAGDTCVTRRAKQLSTISATVFEFDQRHKRRERRGVLVEKKALDSAQAACLGDQSEWSSQRFHAALRREDQEHQYFEDFKQAIRESYPGCREEDVLAITEHACEKYSRRVGRSASAKELDSGAVGQAVRAYIRHNHTNYDIIRGALDSRKLSRDLIQDRVAAVESEWRQTPEALEGIKQCPKIDITDPEPWPPDDLGLLT